MPVCLDRAKEIDRAIGSADYIEKILLPIEEEHSVAQEGAALFRYGGRSFSPSFSPPSFARTSLSRGLLKNGHCIVDFNA